MIKIALVDDHIVFRKSLAILIEMQEDLIIIIEANNGADFIQKIDKSNLPDIVLMDITMAMMDGVETTKWLKQNYPNIKVIALTMLKNELVIIRMLKNGARGYLLKDCEPEELKKALQQVYTRGYFYNEYFTYEMSNGRIEEKQTKSKIMMNEGELNFLRHCCTEKTYKEIAEAMSVSFRTIDGYRDALFQKLQVTTRVGLVIYAIKNQLVVI